MTPPRKLLCCCLLPLSVCLGAAGDDKPLADKNLATVTKIFAALAEAYNARNPKAIAELFTPTCEFIDATDNVFEGREAIAKEFTALFEINTRNSVSFAADDVREISPGVLAVDGVASFAAKEKAKDDSDAVTVDFSAFVIKQVDGGWLFASIRSEGEESVLTPHARLKDLEWLIGEWVDESPESSMHTKTGWSEDGNFILTSFTIRVAGRNVMNGTQRIGWDGALEKFRSWVFDSEGGHAEAIWTEMDDHWVAKSTGVRPDGDACSATQTYEPKGADTYWFTVTDRIVGDEAEPDFTARVVRKPPEPETAANTSSAPGGK